MSVHTQIDISRKSIINAILIIGLAVLLYFLRDLLLIVLSAIVISSFVEAGVKKLAKRMPRGLAVGIVYFGIVAFLAIFFYIFIPAFVGELSNFLKTIGNALPNSGIFTTSDVAAITNTQTLLHDILKNATTGDVLGRAQAIIAGASGTFFSFFGAFFGGIINLLLVFIISFFFAIRERGVQQFLRIITPRRHESYVVNLWERAEYKIGLWFSGQLLLGLIMGLLVYVTLAILGVHYALLIALTAAIFELIPFGFVIATIPAMIFTFLDGGVKLAAITLVVFIVIQQLENYIFQPLMTKRTVGIPPVVVIIAFLVGSKLGGLWGIVLSIPVVVIILEYISDVEKKKYITIRHAQAPSHEAQ